MNNMSEVRDEEKEQQDQMEKGGSLANAQMMRQKHRAEM
jgi:hypothetical protein